jgi:hypothetical protein
VVPTEFDTSLVHLLFPIPPDTWTQDGGSRYGAVTSLLAAGGLSSPLLRIVREERHLCYQVYPTLYVRPEGGYIGLVAKCAKNNIDAVLKAFDDVLAAPEIRTPDRWQFCRDALTGRHLMRIPLPNNNTDAMEASLFDFGRVMHEDELYAQAMSLSHEDALTALDSLKPNQARVLIFEGK